MDWARFDREAERLRLLNLLVWKDGKEVLRRDYDGEIRRNQYSVTKSFTSIAVGIAERQSVSVCNRRRRERTASRPLKEFLDFQCENPTSP